MNKLVFINQLRATANEFTPLTQSTAAGALTWNGTEYVKSEESKSFDPYALSWQTVLGVIADLLEAQEAPLSENQTKYLERLLFGGMGSLSDLFFDPKSRGDLARIVNGRLEKQRQALYASFKDD
jgi:hypothetical protein